VSKKGFTIKYHLALEHPSHDMVLVDHQGVNDDLPVDPMIVQEVVSEPVDHLAERTKFDDGSEGVTRQFRSGSVTEGLDDQRKRKKWNDLLLFNK